MLKKMVFMMLIIKNIEKRQKTQITLIQYISHIALFQRLFFTKQYSEWFKKRIIL